MSERKLYEIIMRVAGIFLGARAVQSLVSGVAYSVFSIGDYHYAEAAMMSGAYVVIYMLAAVIVIVGAIPVSRSLAKKDRIAALQFPAAGAIVPAGILLIGIFLLAYAVPSFVNNLVLAISFTLGPYSSEGQGTQLTRLLLEHGLQCVVGLILIFHGRVFPKLRSGWESVVPAKSGTDSEDSEPEDSQD